MQRTLIVLLCAADTQFSMDTLLEFCGNNVRVFEAVYLTSNVQSEDMVEFYLTNMNEMRQLCPPTAKKPAASSGASSAAMTTRSDSKAKTFAAPTKIQLSCGTLFFYWLCTV